MATDLAELSSLSSTLDQVMGRIAHMGDAARAGKEDELANELFSVERALSSAHRRLARLVERSRRG
ncbi:MAG: hypothetical protein ACYCSF_03640 [Acidimicrobiales bacterium]